MGHNHQSAPAQIPAGEIAKNLIGTGSIFTKPTDTTQAQVERAAKDEVVTQAQTAALKTAAQNTPNRKHIAERPYRKTRAERVFDIAKRNLEIYRTAANGSVAKVDAIVKVLEAVEKQPTKQLLDEIYNFFLQHKNEAFLDPMNALQNTAILDRAVNLRLRLFYDVMMRLATNTATKNSVSLEIIRSVFRNDNFTNWVSFKIRNLSRSK